MEHLNRVLKNSIHGLGTASAIERVARALGTISPFLQNFDKQNNISELSGFHHRPGADKDMKIVIDELRVFSSHQNRTHQSFPSPRDPLHALKQEEVRTWIVKHITILSK